MRSRSRWMALLGGILLLGCLLTLAVGRARRPASTSGWVVLQAGRYESVSWRLWAREQQHTLCLALSPGNPTATGPDEDGGWTGGCGFNTDHPSGGYFVSGPGPAGAISSFGPLPARASSIRVARGQTIPTFALPAGHGLPAGRYWLFIPPTFWPNQATGPAAVPQPLDDHGNPVGFTRF